MPTFEHGGATIYYEESGRGFPVLTFAPAGLQSIIDVWSGPSAPVNPLEDFTADFRVIAMDQRNAGGRSRAPITAQDGWHTFAADHIALLDHLRIERCHLYGQCIGGSFIMSLLKAQPGRDRLRRPRPAHRARRSYAARALRQVRRVGQDPRGPPGGYRTGPRRALPEPLCARLRLLRRPRVRIELPDAVPGPGRQRRGPSGGVSDELAKLLPNCEFIREWKSSAWRSRYGRYCRTVWSCSPPQSGVRVPARSSTRASASWSSISIQNSLKGSRNASISPSPWSANMPRMPPRTRP